MGFKATPVQANAEVECLHIWPDLSQSDDFIQYLVITDDIGRHNLPAGDPASQDND